MDDIIMSAELRNWDMARKFLEKSHQKYRVDSDANGCDELCVACEEIFTNIANYAYPNQAGNIRILYDYSDGKVNITFEDEGIPFNPLLREEPKTNRSIDDLSIGGLGVYMCRKYTDDLIYEYSNHKNRLTLMKKFKN